MKEDKFVSELRETTLYEKKNEAQTPRRPFTEVDGAMAESQIPLSRDAAAGWLLGYAIGFTARHLSVWEEPQVRGAKIDHAIDEAFKTLAGEETSKEKILELRKEFGKKVMPFMRRFFDGLIEDDETTIDREVIYNRSEAYLKAKYKYLQERLKLDRPDTDMTRRRLEEVKKMIYDRKHNVRFSKDRLFVTLGEGPYPWEKEEK